MCWRDFLGATIYDSSSRTSHWRLVRDEHLVVQSESAAWELAVTWFALLWAVAPQRWPTSTCAALTAGYLRAVADWMVLPPPTRCSRLMRAGECEWPVRLSHPFAHAGTLPRYAMGESVCWVAGQRLELVGRAVPVSVMDPAERGACPGVVLSVGAQPSSQDAVPEVLLALPTCSRALFPGCTLQPLGEGPLVAFPSGAAPPGHLTAPGAFFPMEEAPPRNRPRKGDGPEPQAGHLDLGLGLNADKDDEYLLN